MYFRLKNIYLQKIHPTAKKVVVYGAKRCLFFGSLALFGYIVVNNRDEGPSLPEESMWIEIDFSQPLIDCSTSNLFTRIMNPKGLVVRDIVEALKRAQKDTRVRGVVGKFSYNNWNALNLAKSQEVREAILKFRQDCNDSKFTVAYADSFGESGQQGLAEYYVASSFKNIYIQPSGVLGLLGICTEQYFLRDTLKKYGIHPQISTRAEFKNALNFLTQKGFTKHHRQATESLLRGLVDEVVIGISEARGISKQDLQKLIDVAPLRPELALKGGLITDIKYGRNVLEEVVYPEVFRELIKMRELATTSLQNKSTQNAETEKHLPITFQLSKQGGSQDKHKNANVVIGIKFDDSLADQRTRYQIAVWNKAQASGSRDPTITALNSQKVSLQRYLSKKLKEEKRALSKEKNWSNTKNKYIVIVNLAGEIVRSSSPTTAAMQERNISSQEVVALLENLQQNAQVSGVVIRVNSPGGSALGSDSIARAIEQLKETAKIPVVCSMSDYAASGGYMIAVACDSIVAQPTTITGSIGVIGGKVSVHRFFERYGIKFDRIRFGKNSNATSAFEDYDETQQKLLDEEMDAVYASFIDRVAKGRKQDSKQIKMLARGRVWTGRQAQERGLVDHLGGLEVAVQQCASLAKLDLQDSQVVVKVYSKPETFIDKVFSAASGRDREQHSNEFREALELARFQNSKDFEIPNFVRALQNHNRCSTSSRIETKASIPPELQ